MQKFQESSPLFPEDAIAHPAGVLNLHQHRFEYVHIRRVIIDLHIETTLGYSRSALFKCTA